MRFSFLILSILITLLSCKQEKKPDTYKEFIPEKTDSASLNKYYYEISNLVTAGKYNEALARHIWFHNHILEFDSAMAGVRLSFVLGDWKKLGYKFKPAKDSLYKIRDIKTERIIQHGSSPQDFDDVLAINREYDENAKTISLYQLMSEKYPELAQKSAMLAYRVLLDENRYDLVQKYLKDPIVLYNRERNLHMDIDSSLDLKNRKIKKLGSREFDEAFNFQEMFVNSVTKIIDYSKAIKNDSAAAFIQKDALAIVSYDKLKDIIKAAY